MPETLYFRGRVEFPRARKTIKIVFVPPSRFVLRLSSVHASLYSLHLLSGRVQSRGSAAYLASLPEGYEASITAQFTTESPSPHPCILPCTALFAAPSQAPHLHCCTTENTSTKIIESSAFSSSRRLAVKETTALRQPDRENRCSTALETLKIHGNLNRCVRARSPRNCSPLILIKAARSTTTGKK